MVTYLMHMEPRVPTSNPPIVSRSRVYNLDQNPSHSQLNMDPRDPLSLGTLQPEAHNFPYLQNSFRSFESLVTDIAVLIVR